MLLYCVLSFWKYMYGLRKTTELKLIIIQFGKGQMLSQTSLVWIVYVSENRHAIRIFYKLQNYSQIERKNGVMEGGQVKCYNSMVTMMTSMSWAIWVPLFWYMPNMIHVVHHIFHTVHLHFLFWDQNKFFIVEWQPEGQICLHFLENKKSDLFIKFIQRLDGNLWYIVVKGYTIVAKKHFKLRKNELKTENWKKKLVKSQKIGENVTGRSMSWLRG